MTKGWQAIRLEVLKRDRYTCQNCGLISNNKLHVHHIIPRHLKGLNILDNLKTVCKNCHNKLEPKSRSAIAKLTSIQIEAETRDKLRSLGRKGDSYDDIIIWLIQELGGKKRR